MATSNSWRSNLWSLNNVVQGSFLAYPKELMIDSLREFFSQDSYFHWTRDKWGFAKISDLTDVDLEAGLHDDEVSRIFIGEKYRYDVQFFPSILVSSGSFNYVPISFNRNENQVKYRTQSISDGYSIKKFLVPDYFEVVGAYEGELNVEVHAGSISERDEIVELIAIFTEGINYHEFIKAGVAIRPVSISTPQESEDNNDKIYKQTLSYKIRTEFRRQIPISTTLDLINICVDFENLSGVVAPNIEIQANVDLVGAIEDL